MQEEKEFVSSARCSSKDGGRSVVLEGWLARDKDGSLNLFVAEPDYGPRMDAWLTMWDEGYIPLPKSYFPEITFANSPQLARLAVTF